MGGGGGRDHVQFLLDDSTLLCATVVGMYGEPPFQQDGKREVGARHPPFVPLLATIFGMRRQVGQALWCNSRRKPCTRAQGAAVRDCA